MKYILALDQGTTSSRVALIDEQTNVVEILSREFPQIYPEEGWVEHDPMDIWASQYGVMMELVAKSGVSAQDIAAIGITNQRETTIVWDKNTGKPVYNAIVWQCRRTAGQIVELQKQGFGERIRRKTGLIPDAYFSASKVKWILDNVEGARKRAEKGDLLFGTVDTWLVWKLTDGKVFATDRTNASRTMLYNINTDEWDAGMLEILGIPRSMLPEIKSSSEVYGCFDCMGASIPISGIAGDQQAALFGQCCFEAGEAKNTYGTGCFLLANTGNSPVFSEDGLLTTVAATGADEPMEYALEGSVFVGGAVIQWLRDEMKLIYDARDSEYFARKVSDSGGVYLVPAFVGLGAPHWDMNARGTVVGITRGTKREHIIRAALESIAYQTEDVLEAMNRSIAAISESGITRLNVDGGASANDLLLQMQSDLSGIEVARCATTEATAAGAAYLAGLAVGFFKSREDIRRRLGESRVFTPEMREEERSAHRRGWRRAVKACRAFSEEDE